MNDSEAKEAGDLSGPAKHPDADNRAAPVSSFGSGAMTPVALAEALRNKWFEIWYQPKIDLKRKYLAGAEALARVRHPQFGVLPAANFLADADEKSLAELMQYALIATLSDWTSFEDAGFGLQLSLNVPVRVLFKLPIPRLVAQYRPTSKRWPGVTLEVTADEIARSTAHGNELINYARMTGVSIAVDHFGAGYVSMASLRDLPFAELKIHRSFVSGCAADAANSAICQTAIDLAHRFGGVAVAEGLESTADLDALIAMGCDFGQGALISPPTPKARLLELLRQRTTKPRLAPAKETADGVATVAAERVGRVA